MSSDTGPYDIIDEEDLGLHNTQVRMGTIVGNILPPKVPFMYPPRITVPYSVRYPPKNDLIVVLSLEDILTVE